MVTIRHPRAVQLVLSAALVSTASAAIAQPTNAIDPPYDHLDSNTSLTYEVAVGPNQFFVVEIQNTCPGSFSYEYVGVGRAEKQPPPVGVVSQESVGDAPMVTLGQFLADSGICVLRKGNDASTKTLRIPHQARFSGYLVEIEPKTEGRSTVEAAVTSLDDGALATLLASTAQASDWPDTWKSKFEATRKLDAVTLVITVDDKGWQYDVTGGFAVSELTDDEFAMVTRNVTAPGAATPQSLRLVVAEPAMEDDYRLGLGGFIHMYHSNLKDLAGTFGLGIHDSSDLNFYAGVSWRMGGKAYLTAGLNWGPVSALPAGTRVSPDPSMPGFDASSPTDFARLHPVTDDNALNNLGTRTDQALFISVSYSFLNPGIEAFKGKFATADDTPGAQ